MLRPSDQMVDSPFMSVCSAWQRSSGGRSLQPKMLEQPDVALSDQTQLPLEWLPMKAGDWRREPYVANALELIETCVLLLSHPLWHAPAQPHTHVLRNVSAPISMPPVEVSLSLHTRASTCPCSCAATFPSLRRTPSAPSSGRQKRCSVGPAARARAGPPSARTPSRRRAGTATAPAGAPAQSVGPPAAARSPPQRPPRPIGSAWMVASTGPARASAFCVWGGRRGLRWTLCRRTRGASTRKQGTKFVWKQSHPLAASCAAGSHGWLVCVPPRRYIYLAIKPAFTPEGPSSDGFIRVCSTCAF